MTEVLFYHLLRQPLEAVLPTLLQKSIARGWRVVVEVGDEERLASLDDHLWTYSDDSFLPHGTAREPDAADQPIVLATGPDNPNGARVRFVVAGASAPDALDGYERVVLIFDGRDEDALAAARADWRRVKSAGAEATYWQQDEDGRWGRKA
ncbi:DNA polymerase III subunit chi [Chelatococcus reniformis]|uniref:DNA polymerase III subunit chi n=1 Tax=Chelatococcus reniformis TaxID=1494448 RepID=A0A916UEN8_9HYPH|nr:DNA polymerase III subunit chi [Chelatococcus reniformis]GGC69158.1 DNA polymerase III subunit chi [Chelatococcus reniformis]